MGQYHIPVNLDKKEFIDPHQLGVGLKQWEQFASQGGTCAALFALLCVSNHRGGGDLQGEEYDPTDDEGVLGRWAGDRLAVVGDYGQANDLGLPFHAGEVYEACSNEDPEWTDISELVVPVLEKELGVKLVGEGWRHMVPDPEANYSILE